MAHFVLAVEQDRRQLRMFRAALATEEQKVIAAETRGDAIARAAAWTPAVAVVGTGFRADTVEIVRDLRREGGLRTLVIAHPGEDALIARALEAGAVGFETTPSRARLAVRVQEIIEAQVVTDGHFVTAGPVTLDLQRRSLVRPRPQAALTPCEFEILRWLLTPPGRTFTRRQLLATDRAAFPPRGAERHVDRHVTSLRRKLGATGDLIEPSGGIGWRFAVRRAAPGEIEFPLTNVNYEV